MRIWIVATLLLSFETRGGPFEDFIPNSKGKWDSANHPAILVKDALYHLPSLPLKASLESSRSLWSDSYWPRNSGGISLRWQDLTGDVRYRIYSQKEAKALGTEEIAKLSPAEKFDLLQNDYGFSFTRKVIRQNPLNRPDWEGICHGWAQASLFHPQFSSTEFTNKSGQRIRFASSDVAGLMSYFYAKVGKGKTSFLGRRCWENPGNTSVSCTDMNAGAFHVVLANLVPQGKSFIMDLDPYKHVWNFPVLGYESELLEERSPSPGAALSASREVLVRTKLFFVQETGPEWNPPLRAVGFKDYLYWLELDASDLIVGGNWSEAQHPDFAWVTAPVKIPHPYSLFISP